MHVFFSTVSNSAMVACNAPRVGVPSSRFQLLVILCGHLLDAQGQGKLTSYRLCLFLVWVQDREHAPDHQCHSASSYYTYFQLIYIFCFVCCSPNFGTDLGSARIVCEVASSLTERRQGNEYGLNY